MLDTVKLQVNPEEIIKAVKAMSQSARETFWRICLPLPPQSTLRVSGRLGPITRPGGSKHTKMSSASDVGVVSDKSVVA